jgi:hypothetical protein
MLRTAGTLMVKSKTQDQRNHTPRQSNHGNFGFLRQATVSSRTLRRDVFLGVTFNILYSLLTNLISSISSSMTWDIIAHLIVGVLLSNLHLRWTCAILSSKRPAQTRILSFPGRRLVLPSLVYILAYQLTAKLPTSIARTISIQRPESLGGIAFADTVILATAFGLRMLVLYPAFATYIHTEIRQVDGRGVGESTHDGQERSSRLGLSAYANAVRLCFERTTPWFGLLHLQMVFVLAVFELLVTFVVYKMVF